jgi:hypothetical protein
MKKFLWIALLLVQGSALAQRPQQIRLKDAFADFPRSQLQLKTNGPVSIDVSQGDRAAYEQLAEIAGLNLVIDPDFRDSSNGPTRIENADMLQAFDILSARTGSFVEVLNSNTVIVAKDNQTKRRDYEAMVLKTFYLPGGSTPQRLTETVTTLRTQLQARYLAINTISNAVVIRDTPTRVAAAEKIIGLTMPLVAGPSTATIGEAITGSHILTLDGTVRDSAPSRSNLSVTATSPVSLKLTDSTRATYEMLAELAGLNVIFDPDFRNLNGQSFKVDRLNVLDALDVLALQTRTFWTPIDNKTIVVAPDNAAKRRDFENLSVKTFYLRNAGSVELTEIVTALRTILNERYLALIPDSGAIVMRDTATKLALAEKMINDLRKGASVVTAAGFPSGSEAGFVLNRRAAETLGVPPQSVQSKVRGALSFDSNDTAQATYQSVAATAGLRVVFDSRFKDEAAVPFKVEHVGIADALDFLSLQTRTIWQMLDADTILVAPDSPTVRADLLPKITKAINLAGTALTPANINTVITALRTILNLRQVSALDDSIVMTDTAENIAFSERMVKDLGVK